MREKINRTNTVLGVFSALIIAASIFVFPFPFVRAVWIREVWGITGLIHAFLFMLISSRISKASLPAPLAGIGIIVNYEILTFFGFFYIAAHRSLQLRDILFLLATVLSGIFLSVLLGDIFKSLCRLRTQKAAKQLSATADENIWKSYHETDSSALVISAIGYLLVFISLYIVLSLDETSQYGGLKIIGVFISPLSFGGIGQEIDYYLQGKQNRFFCIIKSMTHALALASILWVIYRRLSLSTVAI